jgi:hypothetical protein
VKEPRIVPVNWHVSPRFQKWLNKEKERQGLTTKGLLDLLALTYVLSRSGKKKSVTDWPEDLT